MTSKIDHQAVEEAFIDAALDPSRWNHAMDVIASVTGAAGAVLLPISGAAVPGVPYSNAMGEVVETYFSDRWHEQDERSKGIPLNKPVTDDLDIFDEQYIKRNAFYQEFLAPFGLQWFAGVRVAAGEDDWCISIQRTFSQGLFSDAEKNGLLRLSRSLAASVAVAKAVGFAAAGAALDALEASGSAAILFNSRGEVARANGAAELMLRGDIKVVNRKLVGSNGRTIAAFDRALRDLIWRPIGTASSGPVLLERTGRLPLLAYLVRPSSLASNALADYTALAIIVDIAHRVQTSEAGLRALFGLTAAEARLAVRLGSGQSLEEAAAELHVSKETLRAHLKAIFLKTETHRQSELAVLVSRL